MRKVYNILGRRPEDKRTVGRRRHRWQDNVKMNLGKIGWEDVDWMHLTQDRDKRRATVNTIMNRRVP
jgi:hypothetical protein